MDEVKDKPQRIYTALSQVMLACPAIARGEWNDQQGFAYRSIDQVYDELRSLLGQYRVIVVPTVKDREVTARTTSRGTEMSHVRITLDTQFISADDGSSVTVTTYGEGMDAGDKSLNKSMTAAMKYALTLTFLISGTQEDGDSVSPEIVNGEAKSKPKAKPKPKAAAPAAAPASDDTPAADIPDGQGDVKVTKAEVAKSGTGAKGDWHLYVIHLEDGRKLSTFDSSYFEIAEDAITTNSPCYAAWATNEKGYVNLTRLEITGSPGELPSEPPPTYVSPPDTIVVTGAEEVQSGDTRYWRIDTDDGRMGVTDADVWKALEPHVGKADKVSVRTKLTAQGTAIVAVEELPF